MTLQHIVRFRVAGLGIHEEIFQTILQGLKGWTLFVILLPAVQHDCIESIGGTKRRGHSVSLVDLLQNLCVGHSGVRDAAIRHQLREQDTEGPNIRLDTKAVHQSSLRSSPLDRKLGTLARSVLVFSHHASQAKVGNFAHVILSDQNVASSKIAVDKVLRLQIRHPRGDLCCHVDELRKLQRFALIMQIVQQAAVLHELNHDVERNLIGANSVELNELWMTKLLHDRSLLEEVIRGHGTLLEGLDSHRGRRVPNAFPDISELTSAQLLRQANGLSGNLPLILGLVVQIGSLRKFLAPAGLRQQHTESIRIKLVVVDEFGQRSEGYATSDVVTSFVQGTNAIVLDDITFLDRKREVALLALALSDKERASLTASHEKLLRVLTPNFAVKPLLRLNTLSFGNVVAWNVAKILSSDQLRLPPVSIAVVDDLELVALAESQILLGARIVIEERNEGVWTVV
eukprot:m.215616 g.215616  ORF g.215616 m.215616 type:complete len:457 (+) comp54082_c1_seq1:325-1695(+)